ncbi:MAG: hypothetical protein RIG82_10690 [Phycisphaeraceae bacterium]
MNALINWVRSNPLTLVAGIVAIVSLGVMVWFMLGSAELRDELRSEARAIDKLRSYRPVQVELPPSAPGEKAYEASNVMVNAQAIERVKAINNQMASQAQSVIDAAIRFNRDGMLEDQPVMFGQAPANLARGPILNGLFPAFANDSVPYRARDVYRASFPALLTAWTPDGPAWRLDAGTPPSQEEIAGRISEVEADLFQEGDRSQADEQAIQHEIRSKRAALIQLLRERAQMIHVYAETNPQFMPFQIGAWVMGTGQPQPLELWEAQMQLWIQQDIVAAIAWANRVWEDGSDGSDSGQSVIIAPIKRLLGINVIPGYVGIHTVGGMGQAQALAGATGPRNSRSAGGFSTGGASSSGGSATSPPTNRNFYASPTGRVSNSLYDVRHATLSLHVDVAQIPRVFEAFSRINFMTVIDCAMSDVDEYGPDGLAGGYYYGTADVVQLDLVVESVFLRQWTLPLMPEEAKDYIGISR